MGSQVDDAVVDLSACQLIVDRGDAAADVCLQLPYRRCVDVDDDLRTGIDILLIAHSCLLQPGAVHRDEDDVAGIACALIQLVLHQCRHVEGALHLRQTFHLDGSQRLGHDGCRLLVGPGDQHLVAASATGGHQL